MSLAWQPSGADPYSAVSTWPTCDLLVEVDQTPHRAFAKPEPCRPPANRGRRGNWVPAPPHTRQGRLSRSPAPPSALRLLSPLRSTLPGCSGNETRIDPSSCHCKSAGQTAQRSSRLSSNCLSSDERSKRPYPRFWTIVRGETDLSCRIVDEPAGARIVALCKRLRVLGRKFHSLYDSIGLANKAHGKEMEANTLQGPP